MSVRVWMCVGREEEWSGLHAREKESKRQKNRRKRATESDIAQKKNKKMRGHGSRDVKGKQDTDRIKEQAKETGHL